MPQPQFPITPVHIDYVKARPYIIIAFCLLTFGLFFFGYRWWQSRVVMENIEKEPLPQPQQKTDIATAALATAIKQIGVREKPEGSNDGPEVSQYLASVGIRSPAPWCMSFVYWAHSTTAKANDTVNPLYKTGGCLMQWQKTKCKKVSIADAIANPELVTPGAIFIIDHGSGKGHTGFVRKIENGIIHTVEGNTNDNGSRNGIGVFSLQRKLNKTGKIIGFILPNELA
jgi:hypothetical protein